MADEIIFRKDVPQNLTWDLSLIYETEEEMYHDAQEMEELGRKVAEAYRGKLDTPENIEACLTEYRKVCELRTLIGNYCDLAVSVDYYDTHNQERYGKIERRISVLMSSLSFIDSEQGIFAESAPKESPQASRGDRACHESAFPDAQRPL